MPEKFSFQLETLQFKGDGSGPSMVITGAIHGNEQTGTYTAHLIAEKLKNEHLLGDVAILPICNESAFKARQRQATQDGEDLNRIFPGNTEGTYSYQLANHIWEQTASYDYVLDLHCCGIYGHLYTMCWYSRYDFHHKLCQWLGIETVIHTAGTGGQFYLECCEKRSQKGLLIEFPGGQPGGVIHTEVAKTTCDKIINYMKLIGVLKGEGAEPTGIRLCGVIDKSSPIAEEDGIYQQVVKPGDFIKKGDCLAIVNGKPIPAEMDVVITASSIDRYVFKGDHLISMAPSAELPPGAIQPTNA